MPDLDEVAVTDVEEGGDHHETVEVGPEEARTAWAESAREVLLEKARRYQSVITLKELAAQAQDRSGIHTEQQIRHWIGDVLGRVAAENSAKNEPLLVALAVDDSGSVGDNYASYVVAAGQPEPTDSDEHASRERLECYRHFEAPNLPADGGRPELVAKLAAARTRARKASFEERAIPTCPKCHLQLAATGVCDNCD